MLQRCRRDDQAERCEAASSDSDYGCHALKHKPLAQHTGTSATPARTGTPLAPKGVLSRFCDCGSWSLGGRRVRSSRTGLGLAALAHPGFVRIRIAVVEYGRGKVGASTAPRRRPQKPSHARRRAASRRRERALRSALPAPVRDGRRARALSHLSPRRSTVAVSQLCRGITTEPQRGARPAPPSHELVSRPPRWRKPTPCLKACSNDSRHCTRPRATLQPPLSSLLCRFAAVAAARRCHGRASDTPLRAVRLHILRLSRPADA